MDYIKWKNNHGNNYKTSDLVLWINFAPTNNYIEKCDDGYFSVYVNGNYEYATNSKKEAREYILNAIGYC